MIKRLKRNLFPFLIAFSALSVSASAAFYSVSGLSKLFAGASFEVIIMAGSLEVAKLVTASLLYQYWNDLNKLLRTYLTVSAVVLVLITSMGIYGFLSAAYQETYNKLSIVENEKAFIQQKIDFYDADVSRYDDELKRISNNISTLSSARSQQIQVRDTSVVGGVRTTISTSELRAAQARIKIEEQNRKDIQAKREVAADSLQKFQLQVLELDNNTEIAGELGPLQYLSGLTGTPMDKIINILLLVIIFVFDPLAISLVVAANFAFDKAKPKENLYGELEDKMEGMREVVDKYDDLQEEIEDWDTTLQDGLEDEPWGNEEELERRMNIIGQNGNEGEHYGIDVKDAEEIESKEEFLEQLDKIEKKKKEDWKVVDENNKPIQGKVKTGVPFKVLEQTRTQIKVQEQDGTVKWVNKKGIDNNKRYL